MMLQIVQAGTRASKGKSEERAMAIYIPIRKVAEDAQHVEYSFTSGDRKGKIRFNKSTGDYSILEPSPIDSMAGVAARVIYVVREHLAEGEFPDKTSWSA